MSIVSLLMNHKELGEPFYYMKNDLGEGISIHCLFYKNEKYRIYEYVNSICINHEIIL